MRVASGSLSTKCGWRLWSVISWANITEAQNIPTQEYINQKFTEKESFRKKYDGGEEERSIYMGCAGSGTDPAHLGG